MSFLYLGSPYSHPDPLVQEERYRSVLSAMSVIAKYKIPVYCPIAVWHPASIQEKLPGDHIFWWTQDEAFLRSCYMAWFLVIPGLDDSSGVRNEREALRRMNKPFWNVLPEALEQYCRVLLRQGAFQ